MTANTYGRMLYLRRKQLGFSAAEICSGICSLSTYSHYENDEIKPDLFTMSVFPERMGLDTSHINFVCSRAELLISAIRSEIQKKILAGNFHEADSLIEQYKAVRINHGSRLHDQYVLLQRGIIAEIQGKYHEAAALFLEGMSLTNVSLSSLRSRYLLSRQEFELIYRYSRIQLNSSSEFQVIYNYLSYMDDSDLLKKKYFAVCAYHIAELSLNERDTCSAFSYVLSGISYQQKIYQIINIDRGLSLKKKIINFYNRCLNDEEDNILEYSLIVKKIFERYSVSFSSDIIKLSKPDLIRYQRNSSGITQEKMSEDICDVTTLRRYENGTLDPRENILNKLMNKIGVNCRDLSSDRTALMIHDVTIIDQIESSIQTRDYEKLDRILEPELCQNSNTDSVQFSGNLKLIAKYGDSADDKTVFHFTRLIKLSIPDFDGLNIPESAILNETEIELLNGLAISYQYIGRIDSAGLIWKQLSDYMDKCFVVNVGKIKYRILVNYSNVLGLSQKYEECISVCIKGIRMLCSDVTQNVIYNFVFNIGWCLCYKNMNSENRVKYKKGIRYIDAAINLCRYFDESKSSLDTMITTRKMLADKL